MNAFITMMPLVHTMDSQMNTGQSTQALPAGENFVAKLNALLADAPHQQGTGLDSASSAHIHHSLFMMNMALPMMEGEGDELDDILNLLFSLLSANDDELEQLMAEVPELQQLLLAAMPLLASMDESYDHSLRAAGWAQHDEGPFIPQLTTDGQSKLSQLRQVISHLFAFVQQSEPFHGMQAMDNQVSSAQLRSMLQMMSMHHQESDPLTNNLFTQSSVQASAKLVSNEMLLSREARIAVDQLLPNSNVSAQTMTASEGQALTELSRLIALLDRMLAVASTAKSWPQLTQMPAELNEVEQTIQQPLTTTFAHEMTQSSHTEMRLQSQQQPAFIHAQQWIEQSAPFIIKQVKIAQSSGFSEARIALVPEQLGHVNIHIVMKNGQMIAQFMAETIQGKMLLEGQLTQLRHVLQEQGIQVNKLEVVQGQQSELFQQPREQHTANSSNGRHKHIKPDYESINDEFSMDVEAHLRTHHHHVYGSSFEAVI